MLSIAASSATIVMTASTSDAACPGVRATWAPSEASSSARLCVLLYTVSEWPAWIRLRAISEPMLPRPRKPTFISRIPLSLGRGRLHYGFRASGIGMPTELAENPAGGTQKLGLYTIEIGVKQFAVALAPFAGDHHRIDIRKVRLHHHGRDRIVHGPEIQGVRADENEVGLLARCDGAEAILHAQHARAFDGDPAQRLPRGNRGGGGNSARRGAAFSVVKGALMLERHARDGEHIARNDAFQINTERRSGVEFAQTA